MIERVDLNQRPPKPVRLEWAEWLRRHGVNPSDVPLTGGRIERHEDTYRLVHQAYARNADGNLYKNQAGADAVRETRVVQLEGPPLPFPDGREFIEGTAGCPVGECDHPGPSHEADEYGPDGAPVRPICCAGDCRCGDQWRN